ncbi:MAG: hypothetical protein ABSG28_10540 [Methanoregula sp.]|uniref:hypothetical protein n=1 Tax=Methanoregula sp. TaxID=2052170 RepID=UPI003C226B8A
MTTISITQEDVIAPGAMASGALYSNRINPCGTVAPHSSPAAGETPYTVCGDAGGAAPAPIKKHSHCSPYVYEAMGILKDHGYAPYRLTGDRDLPGAVIATKGPATLMISVLYSRKQVPDGHTLRVLFPETVDHVRALVKTSPHRCMIWVTSPVSGWRYYRADIGGISYDWDVAKEMQQ